MSYKTVSYEEFVKRVHEKLPDVFMHFNEKRFPITEREANEMETEVVGHVEDARKKRKDGEFASWKIGFKKRGMK
ncbi:hypothetical protein IV37_GL000165 [Fructilactobacillus fructivorans]|uniref:hypothetical protein n=1 Tax=Fructilactobacillus fructivorans TaxID=1614 RepID=UPI0007049183|nr:hypothetical protein [Fructilactobacillus fructivorans]KRN13444.1 hypothetical protein IV37_GL000165 [Fructilactobacillus fructivorans]